MPNGTSSARRPGWRGIIIFSLALFLLVLAVMAARLQFGNDPALGQLTAQAASASRSGGEEDGEGHDSDDGGILSTLLGGGSDAGGGQAQPAPPTTRSS